MSGSYEKVVYYSPAGRVQNSEWELINYPPEGYKFHVGKVSPLIKNSFIFDKVRLQVLDRLVPLNLTKALLEYNKILECSLVYAYNHVVPQKVPWCVNVEWANVLVGRDTNYFKMFRKLVENYLASEYCKGIFTWTNKAKDSIIEKYDCSRFQAKIKVIPPAVHEKKVERNYSRVKKLLFVGSIDTPEDYYAKGAKEVLQAFKILSRDNKDIELTMRVNAPLGVNHERVKIIRDILPKEEYQQLFKEADIFIFPSHYAQEMVVLEAMSWGLPVVTSWVATFGEYIENWNNGIVLSKPMISYFQDGWLISETTARHDYVKELSAANFPDVVSEIVGSVKKLIRDDILRARIGIAAKTTANQSIARRNKVLKEVFDKC